MRRYLVKRKWWFVLLALLLTYGSAQSGCTNANQAVKFSDANLATAVMQQLSLSGPPTCAQMQRLAQLGAHDVGIKSLEGLQYATHLFTLKLNNFSADPASENKVSDLTPLAHLSELTWLDLSGNRVSDLTPLAHLSHLAMLVLDGNEISDLGPLVASGALRGGLLYVRDNPLGPEAEGEIATLEARGATVYR